MKVKLEYKVGEVVVSQQWATKFSYNYYRLRQAGWTETR